MRQHMGAHRLEASWEQYGKVKPANPCGFCGVRGAVGARFGEQMMDASDVVGCPVGMAKSASGTYKPKHVCKLVGAIDYALGAAGKSTLSSPCTDRPIVCTECKKVPS